MFLRNEKERFARKKCKPLFYCAGKLFSGRKQVFQFILFFKPLFFKSTKHFGAFHLVGQEFFQLFFVGLFVNGRISQLAVDGGFFVVQFADFVFQPVQAFFKRFFQR